MQYPDGTTGKERLLDLSLPNGRKPRTVSIHERLAPIINGADFENWILLGEYAAVFDTRTGVIEAVLRTYGPPSLQMSLKRLAQNLELDRSADADAIDADLGENTDKPVSIRLTRESEPNSQISAEICVSSPELTALERGLFTYGYSLRISTNNVRGHDQALRLLKEFSNSFFLELDLTHQILLGLAVSTSVLRARRRRARRSQTDSRPLRMPKLKYSHEATSLYTYGRSAAAMPLLEFLAYYQVMEFHFPIYSKRELMQRVRHELLDPRFDAANDAQLARVVSILAGGPRGLAESEQLRATLRACADDKGLEEFIKQDPEMEQFLVGKQEIKGVKSLNFSNRDHRLTDQVADRLYQIRCRIVHTKEDGGGIGAEMLLPFGEEASKLSIDISLARYLAQKVLIAGAQHATWV
ncbi:hypothetical protein ABZ949_32935 [Micromonospora tulbaghiae]|uniref:hypothetical protein n=1 Tax=Micromonospora tulbaghiae TaxID=479978 RepID=UPI0033C6FFFC